MPVTESQSAPVYPNEFLRGVIGSTVHGLNVPGNDDLDLMGICLEAPDQLISLAKPFEQHVWRTQPEGKPSGYGDIDLTVYGLRKFLGLASNGNPSVLNLLFVPPEYRHVDGWLADSLRALIPDLISRAAAPRYQGYLRGQRERLIGERGQKRTGYTRRLKYLSDTGWDTKYAMHMIRLGVQGCELLSTGSITLPMAEPLRTQVYDVRRGRVDLADVVSWALELEITLEFYGREAALPQHPNREVLDKWLVDMYLRLWETGEPLIR